MSSSFHVEMGDIEFKENKPEQVLSQMDLKMMQYIRERLNTLKERNAKEINFSTIIDGETKENKIKAFQELLALEAKDMITMRQDEPFGDIVITENE